MGGTQKPVRPTEPNSCRMRKRPEPAVPSDGAAGGRYEKPTEPTLRAAGTRLAREPLSPHPWAPLGTRAEDAGPGHRHGAIPAAQPVSLECRATDRVVPGGVRAHTALLEGLPQPPGTPSPPSPMIYSQMSPEPHQSPAHCAWAQPARPAPAPSWQEPVPAPPGQIPLIPDGD